jgi:DNA-binding GntR family transcriptional regulator
MMVSFKPDKASPSPLHQQISDWILQRIEGGEWPPHYRLKGEADLAKEMTVARGTLRTSLRSLIRAGAIIQVHGKGTFVASTGGKMEQPLAGRLVSFAEALSEQGYRFKTRVLSAKVEPAQKAIQKLLGLTAKAGVFRLERVRSVQREPVIHLVNYVPVDRCPGIERHDFRTARLFEAIEESSGHQICSGKRSFEARAASDALSHYLEIPAGSPLLYLEQLTFLRDGSPVEYSEVYLKADRIRVTASLNR